MAHLLDTDLTTEFVDGAWQSTFPTTHPCGICRQGATVFINRDGCTRCAQCDALARKVN